MFLTTKHSTNKTQTNLSPRTAESLSPMSHHQPCKMLHKGMSTAICNTFCDWKSLSGFY